MATVEIFYAQGNRRSQVIAEAAYSGVRRVGDRPVMKLAQQYTGPNSDYGVFYGLSNGLKRILDGHPCALYADLGYWKRRLHSRYDGYHKLILNARHPIDYFQNRKHDLTRLRDLGLNIKPWRRNGNHIIVAGMSDKAARFEGLVPGQWERDIIAKLKKITDIPITYRAKPSCMRTRAIPGTTFNRELDLDKQLASAHAVVCRQSNVAVDAIVAGVPVYCEYGVGKALSMGDIKEINDPFIPTDEQRLDFLADVSWTQFSTHEIATGLPFQHLKDEGLIP